MIDYKIIRSLRQKRNMTLQELAKKADISVSYLSEIELGKKQPSLRPSIAFPGPQHIP